MKPRWTHLLLDRRDQPIETLDGVTGGHAEIVTQDPLGGSGALTIKDRQDIDWMNCRVQSVYSNGVDQPWPVGTFLLSSPVEQNTAFGRTFQVGLISKVNILLEDTVEERYSRPAGAQVIPAVVALIQSAGETRIAVTDSDSELTEARTWEAGTPKLTIINALLQSAGYRPLWCDGSGQFRVQPDTDPKLQPVAFEFEHGIRSLHLPDWTREQNLVSVPNRVTAVGTATASSDPFRAVATNEDPESPFSYQSRGKWIAHEERGVEGNSLEVFAQYAQRRLRELMDPVAKITVTHAMRPLEPGGLVGFTPADGRRRLATIQRMRVEFRFDTLVSAEWREVL